MRRPTQRERPAVGTRSDDKPGRVGDHRADQQKEPPRGRRGAGGEERVFVSPRPLVVRVAMQRDLEADGAVLMRPAPDVMVVLGQVEGNRGPDHPRRGEGEQPRHG